MEMSMRRKKMERVARVDLTRLENLWYRFVIRTGTKGCSLWPHLCSDTLVPVRHKPVPKVLLKPVLTVAVALRFRTGTRAPIGTGS